MSTVSTKQEAFDFLTNIANFNLVKATDPLAASTAYMARSEYTTLDSDEGKEFVNALNIAVQSFMNQDCAL